MDLSDLLGSSAGKSIISSIAGKLGMDESTATKAVSAAVPAILSGLNKNASTQEGAASIDKALDSHDGGILDNLSGLLGGNTDALTKDGEGILGHIFGGSKDTVTSAVSKTAGVSSSQMGSILSTLAPVVMGYLGKEKSSTSNPADSITGILGGLLGGSGSSSSTSGIMGMVTGMLDKDGDGSIVDDVLGMFGKK